MQLSSGSAPASGAANRRPRRLPPVGRGSPNGEWTWRSATGGSNDAVVFGERACLGRGPLHCIIPAKPVCRMVTLLFCLRFEANLTRCVLI